MSELFAKIPKHWELERISVSFFENTASNNELTSEIPMQFRYGEIIRKKEMSKDDAFLDGIRRYTVVQPRDIMINGLNLNYDFISQRVAIVREIGCMTPAYISLRPKDNVNPYFACYLLKAMDGQKLLHGLGTGIRLTLGFSELKKVFIPLPPYEEQDQIVRFLDWKVSQVNKLINAKKKQIGLLQEFRQAIIEDVLSEISAPNILCRHLGFLQNGISESGDFFTQGTPFVNYGDVYKNPMLPTSVIGKAKANPKQQETYSVKKGDIFFTRTSETIDEVGLTSVCGETIPEAAFSGFVIRFRPKPNLLNNHYAKYFFRSKRVRDYFTQEMNLVTRVSLGQTLLKNLPVLLPKMDAQCAISQALNKKCNCVDSTMDRLSNEITLLGEYRTRLISDVVTGKMDVRNVVVPKYESVVVSSNVLGADESENEHSVDNQEIYNEPVTLIAKPTSNDKASKRTTVFKRLVLSAHILDNIYDEPTAGRVKFEKLLHLSEYCAQIPLQSEFQRAAAGPYDSKSLYSVENQLQKNKWFRHQRVKNNSRAYLRLEKANGYRQYLASNFDEEQLAIINRLIHLFKTAKTIQCEIVSTLYGAWNDFLLEGKKPTDDEIVDEVLTNWHEKKERIERKRWLLALNWMRKNDIVPTGYGISTKQKSTESEEADNG